MDTNVLVAGGGIGGLACALALGREGIGIALLEQADAWGEVGAGLQLGPNAVRVLRDWGLRGALDAVAAYPDALTVRDARAGTELGRLDLGARAVARYGQPYACVHRADLHGLLWQAVHGVAGIAPRLSARVSGAQAGPDAATLGLEGGGSLRGAALIGCDGLWSRVRAALFDATAPRPTGHLAYRGLVRMADLPAAMRESRVGVWLGPRLHAVHYPVRGGEAVNLVVVVHGSAGRQLDARSWVQPATPEDIAGALGPVCAGLRAWIDAAPAWTRWVLHDRPALQRPGEMAQGRVALLGDAAHPMRPYLAQGAAMALEDAWTLGRLVHGARAARPDSPIDWSALLARYAALRAPRNARVQRRSRRNGVVFHARGPLRWGRDLAMAWGGERVLDNAWLYRGPHDPLRDPVR